MKQTKQLVNDKELITEYLAGKESSIEKLIKRHQRRIFSYIFLIVKDRDLAEDIFQDTFIKVIRILRSGSYKEEGKFLQWVLRIAHNLAIDHFRKAKRFPTVDNDKEDFDIFDIIKTHDPSIEDQLITDQIHTDVKNLIQYLPEEQKEVLVMRYYSNLSFKEIAEQTNVSINTALGRMRYAIINLRKIVEEKNIVLAK